MLCVAQTTLELMNREPWVGVVQDKNTHTQSMCQTGCPAAQFLALQEHVAPVVITEHNRDHYQLNWACLDEVSFNAQFQVCIQKRQASAASSNSPYRNPALLLTLGVAALSFGV